MKLEFDMFNALKVLIVALAFPSVVLAQASVPYSFSSGGKAKASEVNANFQALATAINDLSRKIDSSKIISGWCSPNNVVTSGAVTCTPTGTGIYRVDFPSNMATHGVAISVVPQSSSSSATYTASVLIPDETPTQAIIRTSVVSGGSVAPINTPVRFVAIP